MTVSTQHALAEALIQGALRIIDLTHTLSPDFPTLVLPPEFAQATPVKIERLSRYDEAGPAWYWNKLTFSEHTGTHFDAPAHWVTGRHLPRNTVDTMPVEAMIRPACVVDCSRQSAANPDYLLTVEDLKKWEQAHGRIPAGWWVLMRTDWYRKSGADYANLKDDGAHTPGPTEEAIRWLIDERDIIGFGTETIGTDAGLAGNFSLPYPAHNLLHGAGRYGLQCLTNLDKLPAKGAIIVSPPLKVLEGSGSPLRVLALTDSN
ncbi:cyclase family protein [Paracoccus versutus]|uniref:cyclase family protein n=1 Tax=Paracoccus versutus TaxID=34007 RepID=UPI001FB6DC9D|nr:cyclase family protein [Paracoccus versutus]MCJ1901693.1 cyclase family protein [Paracoccus versutus]